MNWFGSGFIQIIVAKDVTITPPGRELWVEDPSGQQMITDGGFIDEYAFVTG